MAIKEHADEPVDQRECTVTVLGSMLTIQEAPQPVGPQGRSVIHSSSVARVPPWPLSLV
jgi:hypothetical protein